MEKAFSARWWVATLRECLYCPGHLLISSSMLLCVKHLRIPQRAIHCSLLPTVEGRKRNERVKAKKDMGQDKNIFITGGMEEKRKNTNENTLRKDSNSPCPIFRPKHRQCPTRKLAAQSSQLSFIFEHDSAQHGIFHWQVWILCLVVACPTICAP